MKAPRFMAARRRDVHSTGRTAQFGYANELLTAAVKRMLNEAELRQGDQLVDYGCASRPYEGLLPAGASYLGADLPGNEQADLVLDADGRLPLPAGSVSAVLSTQVLEHVADVPAYLAECRRVLAPGGTLLLTTHGMMYYHRDPEDYWRWTATGLAATLSRAGFEIVQLDGLMGMGAIGMQIVQDATIYLLPERLRPLYAFVIQRIIRWLDRLYSAAERRENCWTFAVRAVRLDELALEAKP